MTAPSILIAGIGNIFLGDDAFGVEVVQRLARRSLPEGVRVVDFGIRGLDLTFALQEGYEAVVLVDAVPRGGQPGTLYTLEPEPEDAEAPDPAELLADTHNLDPAKVLRLASAMGGGTRRVVLVGCEPWVPESEDEFEMQLSTPVRQAVEEAVPLVESVVAELLGSDRDHRAPDSRGSGARSDGPRSEHEANRTRDTTSHEDVET